MLPPEDARLTDGRGINVVFVHGAGADKASWRPIVTILRDRIRATRYDRRGTGAWLRPETEAIGVAEHADDLADLIRWLDTGPVHVCASSFGAVVLLDLLQTRPELVHSATMFEPAISAQGAAPHVPAEITDQIERALASGRPDEAGAHFYRRVLGERTFNALPAFMRPDMYARSPQIVRDLRANNAYRLDVERVRTVDTPLLLLQGGQSRPAFDASLDGLHELLPHAQRQVLERSGHVPMGEAWEEFADALMTFVTRADDDRPRSG